ncbi:MAG: hypothetical protein IAA85_05615 [Firmicutes bacterium]|nr:hypothetical protein [Candidatus Alectryobacillus merdavium]
MLILTQNGNRVVKFKDITDLYINSIDDDPTIYCNTKYNEDEYDIPLGIYETKERCKEVLLEILREYSCIEQFKIECRSKISGRPKSFVYCMPKE